MENQTQNQELQTNNDLSGEEMELNYWSREFGIAREELLAMVKRGGTFAAAVQNYVRSAKLAL